MTGTTTITDVNTATVDVKTATKRTTMWFAPMRRRATTLVVPLPAPRPARCAGEGKP